MQLEKQIGDWVHSWLSQSWGEDSYGRERAEQWIQLTAAAVAERLEHRL